MLAKKAKKANGPSLVISVPNRAAPMIETGRSVSVDDDPDPPPDDEPLAATVGSPRCTTVSAKSDSPDGEKNEPRKPTVSFERIPTSVTVRPAAVIGPTRCK